MKTTTTVCVLAISLIVSNSLFGQAQAPIQESRVTTAAPSSVPAGATATPAVTPATRAHFVPILISVTDGKGNPVLELNKEQLKMTDSNQPVQPLQLYKASDIPLHLGIILLSTPATFSQQQAAAADLIQKALRPKMDEAFVVTARGKKPWPSDRLDWKSDPAELATMIHGLDRSAGLADAFNFNLETDETGGDENGGRSTIQTYSAGGITVFDAAYAMMNSDPRPARRVLVIFRDPWAHSPGYGNRVNMAVEGQLQHVIGMAQALHIATFVIGLEDTKYNGVTDNNIGKTYISVHAGDDGGAGTANRNFDQEMQSERNRSYQHGKVNVQRIASETGGETYWSTKKNYTDAVNAIVNELAGQYLVTFTPADVPGPVHRLKIVSGGPMRVLVQTDFFYGSR